MRTAKLEESVKEVAKIYFIALRQLSVDRLSSGEQDIYSPFYKYYQDVEIAFSHLNKEQQRIITKEFFYDGYRNWWTSQYKPREFKKKKIGAMKFFLEVFYEIH